MPSLARSVPKPLKVPSLARSVPKPLPKPLKVPSFARSVSKPLKVHSLARSVPKPLSIFVAASFNRWQRGTRYDSPKSIVSEVKVK